MPKRGRPVGSKDLVPRRLRVPWAEVVAWRCKFQLLQILLYTRDLVSLSACCCCSGADAEVRFLFAHTEGFQAWCADHHVDSLGLQLRTWMRRDLLPLVEGTRFFTQPLPEGAEPRRRFASLRLLRWVNEWVHRGAPLDCVRTPLYSSAPALLLAPDAVQDGSRIWHESRRAQKGGEADEFFSLLWTL